MPKTVVLTFSPLPSTTALLSAFNSSSSPLASADNSVVHELQSTPDDVLKASLDEDGMIICAGSLASISHLLAPNQRAFFDATEDSYLFRTLISSKYPDYKCYKSQQPWAEELDWSGGRKFVVKPNIGYSSFDTFVIEDAQEQADLKASLGSSIERDFVIEEFIHGLFLCADIVVEGTTVLITSVYQRYDYGIKETGQYHSASLFREHSSKFESFARDVVIPCLPLQPGTRTLFNVEAKLGSDDILRCIEINPFRACGVAPLAASMVFGFNVFDLAFEAVLGGSGRKPVEADAEFAVCFARQDGETAEDLLIPLIKDLEGKDGLTRIGVQRSILMEKKHQAIFDIHDARIFEILKSNMVE